MTTTSEAVNTSTPTTRTDWLLEAEGLCKSYKGRKVVDGVSLKIAPGEVVGLIGPNGAGKTTSFYMVVGLVRPDSGSIRFQGQDVAQMPMYQRARLGMGYLCQEPSIFRRMTVEENIMAMLETLNISATERRERLRHLLDGLGLTHLAKQKAITCSGGEQRRLEITRGLVTNPSFIMLDEPFANIDPIAVQDVQKMIRQLKNMGLGILITDHSVREIMAIVDRTYLIIKGQIKYEGDPENFYKNKEAREEYIGEDFVK